MFDKQYMIAFSRLSMSDEVANNKPAATKEKKTSKVFTSKRDKLKEGNLSAEERRANRQAKAERVQRAIQMYQSGVIKIRIAEQLGVCDDTVSRWLKNVAPPAEPESGDPFEQNLERSVDTAVADSRLAARDEEQQGLLAVAENQASPADKYQAYVAASAIKMLRDNLLNVRGPRTVRELSELDQLIRRNLGLNPKGGGGSAGTLTIDLSILNNAKAANGGASVVVEAEEVE